MMVELVKKNHIVFNICLFHLLIHFFPGQRPEQDQKLRDLQFLIQMFPWVFVWPNFYLTLLEAQVLNLKKLTFVEILIQAYLCVSYPSTFTLNLKEF